MAHSAIEALKDATQCPEKVVLTGHKINDETCKKIGEILQLNKKIRSLYLDGNAIRDVGAAALADAIKSNTTLEYLNISKNQFSYEGARLIFAALKVNRSLRGVDFSFNDLHTNTEDSPVPGRGPLHDLYVMFPFNKTLQYLNLSSTKLTTLQANRIFEGVAVNKSLSWLDVSNNEFTDQVAESVGKAIAYNTTLRHFNMSGNPVGASTLAHFAEALRTNTSLQDVRVSSLPPTARDGLFALLNALETNATVTSLDMSNNSCPSNVGDFLLRNQGLTKLNLQQTLIRNQELTSISKALETNTTLLHLNISQNLSRQEAMGALANAIRLNQALEALDFSYSNVGEGGAALAQALRSNRVLRVVHLNGLKDCSHISKKQLMYVLASETSNLVYYSLNDLGITEELGKELVKSLSRNNKIEELHIKGNTLSQEGSKGAAVINDLIQLFQTSPNLVKLEMDVQDPRFFVKQLDGRGLTEFPPNLLKMTTLRELHIANNSIERIPLEISNLTELTDLNISNNRLLTLPPSMGFLTNLKNLKLTGNSFQTPPPEILSKSTKLILGYLRDLAKGSEPIYRVKLMMVGQENVGKTTLLKMIKRRRIKKAMKKKDIKTISTDGISIEEWQLEVPFDEDPELHRQSSLPLTSPNAVAASAPAAAVPAAVANRTGPVRTGSLGKMNSTATDDEGKVKKMVTISAWDFAGQEIYYTTHQFFLSERAIYMLVWDLRYDDDECKVSYWLQSIRSRTRGAPVIIVGTHLDDLKDPAEATEKLKEVQKKYKKRFPFICGVLAVSCKPDSDIGPLMNKIRDVVAMQEHMGEEIPRTYLEFERLIKQERALIKEGKARYPPIRTWEELRQMGSYCHITDDEELRRCVNLLHDFGSLIHFDDPSLGVSDLAIVDGQFLTNVMSTIITTKTVIRDGLLEHKFIPMIWRAPDFPPDIHDLLLSLLEKFEIAFTLPPQLCSRLRSRRSVGSFSAASPPASAIPSQMSYVSPTRPRSAQYLQQHMFGQGSSSETPPGTPPSTSPLLVGPPSKALPPVPGGPPRQPLPQLPGTLPQGSPSYGSMGSWSQEIPAPASPVTSPTVPVFGNVDRETLIPSLLPEERPDFHLLWRPVDPTKAQFDRRYQLEFVPKGFFSRLVIRVLHLVDDVLVYWRNGLIAVKDKDMFIIEMRPGEALLTLSVRGPLRFPPTETLRMCVEIVEILIGLNNWFNIKVDTFVPCPHCIELGKPEPSIWQFKLEELTALASMGQWITTCEADSADKKTIQLTRLVPDLSLADLEGARIPHNELQLFAEVGKGAFGVIYHALWRGMEVAVKTMIYAKNTDMRQKAFDEFRREVYVMSGMKHPNLVNLLGFCVDPFALVMEYVPCGNLYHFLRDMSQPLDWPLRMKIALDIAKGMFYLHDASPPFIHRDLKSPNILLVSVDPNAEVTAKVGDFGLSSRLFVPSLKEKSVDRDVVNPTWLAPEIIREDEFTEKSDIYSFGIILWELVTRNHPYSEFNCQFMFELEDKIKQGIRPTIPADVPYEYAVLMHQCWQDDPASRPSFLDIIRSLVVLAADLAPMMYIPDDVLKRTHQANMNFLTRSPAGSMGARDMQQLSDDPSDEGIVAAGQFVKQLRHPTSKSSIYSLLCHGNQIWAGCRDGSILIWNAENGQLLARHEGVHKNSVATLLAVGNRVWTHSWGEDIKVWRVLGDEYAQRVMSDAEKDLKEGYLQIRTTGITRKIKRRYFRLRAKRLLMFKTQEDKSPVNILDLVVGVEMTDDKKKFTFDIKPRGGKEKDKICVVFKDKDEHAAWTQAITTEFERQENTYDLEMVTKIEAPDINCLTLLDGYVWAGTTEMRLKVWDPNTFQMVKNVFVDISGLTEIRNMMGLFIAHILEYDHRIWLSVQKYVVCLDKESLIPLRVLDGHSLTINNCVGYDNRLWTCSDDCTVRVWDARTYECLQTFSEFSGKQFTLLRVGSQVWAAGWDGVIRVFSGKTCQFLKSLEQKHQDSIADFAVSHSSVWAASWDGSVSIWG